MSGVSLPITTKSRLLAHDSDKIPWLQLSKVITKIKTDPRLFVARENESEGMDLFEVSTDRIKCFV